MLCRCIGALCWPQRGPTRASPQAALEGWRNIYKPLVDASKAAELPQAGAEVQYEDDTTNSSLILFRTTMIQFTVTHKVIGNKLISIS